ncbi:MAG: methionine adenosyltransferase [Acidimicrobiia bacterium]
MNLSITRRSPYRPEIEFVERKGAGHPDTICDHLAEDLARRLAGQYLANTGQVQHFNVDKAIFAAGAVDVGYGGGHHLKASKLVLVGKAYMGGDWRPNVEELKNEYLAKLMALLPDATDEAFEVDIWLNPSSVDLEAVAGGTDTVPRANDTSFAAVSLPRSPLERAVYEVEHRLNSDDFRTEVPVGRDIKVMGARIGDKARLTVAAPVMAVKVHNRAEYDEVVSAIRAAATATAGEAFGAPVEVVVNQADLADSVYLTLTGTSAEAGDDGQVGRGNRFGGLITPYRPMSLEAAAGKNPAAHVGKTYHAFGFDIATRLLTETGAEDVTLRLLSSIGHPVTDPQAVHVEVAGDVDDETITGAVTDAFADWAGVRDRLIAGLYELY